ncbi:cation-translocating P-type ATPase [Ectobacillus panaciterrae]|uniref:cation-translocating P-type ATPase n=1 Tax=Ectobacillus panaciterrae TaxID=363872 RepID=UPI0003FB82FD|nr:HAD-IC family P-type ATPase [Ectobacillus panaciterrae]
MNEISFKPRSFHLLPGRVRFELFGLQHHPDISEKFEEIFSSIEGVTSVCANSDSGKVLLVFDEKRVSVDVLLLFIKKFEEVLFKKRYITEEETAPENEEENTVIYSEVAATAESTIATSYFESIPYTKSMDINERVPLPLTLSIAGLGILGVKQLVWGRSALARHPLPFFISSAIAISTGYPFLKKGLHDLQQKKKLNVDLLLGISSLGLALVRENLVVLAGISILQYLNWKRRQVKTDLLDQPCVSPQIETYSRRASKFGLVAAGAGFALTRNPLAALGALLAANPRPVLTSTEYAWKQAEYIAREREQCLPENGSMYQLSQTKAVVFEDASLIADNGTIRPEAVSLFERLRPGTMIGARNNRNDVNLEELASFLTEHFKVELKEINEAFPKQRDEVLFIADDVSNGTEKILSFYPSIRIGKLPELAKSYEQAGKLDNLVHTNAKVTSLWNLIGTAIAVPVFVAAPLVNLIADALTLSFLTKIKRWTEEHIGARKQENPQAGGKVEGKAEGHPWHAMDEKEILHLLKTDQLYGLDDQQISAAMQTYGPNKLQAKRRPHWIKSYLAQFKEFTTVVLGTTALLSMVSGHLFDGAAMGSILLLNAAISTMQERKAEGAVEAMTRFVPPNCLVIRKGETVEISAENIVPGDLVVLEAGDRIPADLRLIQGWNLEVNESSLSGESLPVRKIAGKISEKEALSDRANMLYMGTHVTRGKALAVVVQTGKDTEMGHLMSLLNEESDGETPLQRQVTSISKTFMKGALAAGVIVFIAGLLRGNPISQMITTSMALTASAIPEGLPVTITIALTAGVFRMAKKKTLVQNLSSLETLGRTTVICSDKTGTLTKNEMTVKKVATIDAEFDATGEGYAPEGKIIDKNGVEQNSKELDKLLEIGLLCSNTSLHLENERWGIKGDPTEGAIVTLAAKRNFHLDNHKHWQRLHEVPFDSNSGMMTVACKSEEDEKKCFVMSKGSVEKILNCCTHYQKNGQQYALTDEIREEILQQNEKYAEQSLRVLGFAYRPIDHNGENTCFDDMNENLIYVGMAGMIDPPKPDVEKSIREALELGIRPVMITGDHPVTAMAIAKQIGICNGGKKVVVGNELDQMSDEELKNIINDICIFARVTPEHKLRIVTMLQQQGHVVAMTGDGVNDSPAIKRADVGIAMGQAGTQVTKETADMVLKEDHFGSIVEGVKEGRTIIGNIRKALGCLLSGNLAEIIVTSAAVIAGMPLPIVPIQILIMNLLTDALPAMVLAVNPGNKTTQTKRQEIVDSSLYKQVITRGVLLGAGSLSLFALSLSRGASLPMARTIAFATLVAGQLIQTFSWRQTGSKESIRDWSKDRFLVGALGVSWLALLSTIYIGPLHSVFSTVSLPIVSWIPILAVASGAAIVAKPIVNMLTRTKSKMIPFHSIAA